jgi:hypothetical protein
MKKIIFFLIVLNSLCAASQKNNYADSLKKFRDNYISTHEVVTGDDRKKLNFFPIDKAYAVSAKLEKIQQSAWFAMETSGKEKQTYRPYGVLHFTVQNAVLKLNVYQSKDLMGMAEYADYLFVPFTDSTNGSRTYENGRYIDFRLADISNGMVLLDFNKAYNPYCAYVKGIYNCPIPPAENSLPLYITAGEMKFKK